jgi:hypothetical protein
MSKYETVEEARLAQPMGQFDNWNDKLFMWVGPELGWMYIKGLV